MSELQRLQEAEKKLLSALGTANQVAELLSSGTTQAELERLCSQFLADIQDSQVELLQLADRHQQPLPYQNNDYRQRLLLAAAHKQVAGAEAQLAATASAAATAGASAAPVAPLQQQQL